jgi:hypothetical protein
MYFFFKNNVGLKGYLYREQAAIVVRCCPTAAEQTPSSPPPVRAVEPSSSFVFVVRYLSPCARVVSAEARWFHPNRGMVWGLEGEFSSLVGGLAFGRAAALPRPIARSASAKSLLLRLRLGLRDVLHFRTAVV